MISFTGTLLLLLWILIGMLANIIFDEFFWYDWADTPVGRLICILLGPIGIVLCIPCFIVEFIRGGLR
jgi:hypothetical protein